MKRLIFVTTALAFSASIAMAAISANDIVTAYKAQGYSAIAVTTGQSQITVHAVKDGAEFDVVYDATTGAVLHQDAKWLQRGADLSLASASDDGASDAADDSSSNHGNGIDLEADDSSDDHGSDDDGAGHDAHDDHGGDHGGGDDKGGHGGASDHDKSGGED